MMEERRDKTREEKDARHLAHYLKRVLEQALQFIDEYIKETDE